MDWIEITKYIIGAIAGSGALGGVLFGLNRRQKKGEVERLESDVRKLQDNEFRERAASLIEDLSKARATIDKMSDEIQQLIDQKVNAEIENAKLKAENKLLKQKICKKYCCCLEFKRDEDIM